MTLELSREDLRKEHRDCNPSETTFEKFTGTAQEAIRVVGRATYYNSDRSNHNVIYPPQR